MDSFVGRQATIIADDGVEGFMLEDLNNQRADFPFFILEPITD